MTRSALLLAFALSLLIGLMAPLDLPLRAGDAPIGTGLSPSFDLKSQLEKGLKARRPVEFEYIAQVIALVDNETLPRSLVDSSFLWARKKRTRKLQYFQFALRAQAQKLGIATPNLDDQKATLTR
jgi:hypothetical protein